MFSRGSRKIAGERVKVAGGCACGETRYGFYEPRVYEVACHCRACQYQSGGGPSYLIGVLRSQFRVTRGHPGEFVTLAESGHLVTRGFCRTCGTHLYVHSDSTPDLCSVDVGSLDDPSDFSPKLHRWVSEAPAWHRRSWWMRHFRRDGPKARIPVVEPLDEVAG